MPDSEQFIYSFREVSLLARGIRALWHLGSSGRQALGTFVITSQRVLFIPSPRARGLGTPTIESVSRAEELLAAHGGLVLPRDAISANVTAARAASDAPGHRPYSDLTIRCTRPALTKTFRFFGATTAAHALSLLQPASAEAATVSPLATEFAELNLPPDYGLAAAPGEQMRVSWYRTTLAYAYRLFKERRWDYAIKEATRLIEDETLQNNPQYALLLAAAYYVRGSVYEHQRDLARARQDYTDAFKRAPSYAPAGDAYIRLTRE